jgi:hypothetical protein
MLDARRWAAVGLDAWCQWPAGACTEVRDTRRRRGRADNGGIRLVKGLGDAVEADGRREWCFGRGRRSTLAGGLSCADVQK